MSILTWIVVGLIAGWLASLITRGRGFGLFRGTIVGILGALIGGFLSSRVLSVDYVTGFNLPTILISLVGAVILIWVLRLVRRRAMV